MQIAEIEKTDKKEPKTHSHQLLNEKVSIQSSTGYLLQQKRIVNQIFAEFADRCTPFKLNVSKPHSFSVTISAKTQANINKLRHYIIKQIQHKILSAKCGDKKSAVIGAGGLNLKMIKDECELYYIWEDDVVPGLIHIYDRNMSKGYKAANKIQSILDKTSILPLPIGQYGLLIIDNAYWLDFIREHSNAFIVGLDVKPSELHKRKVQQIKHLNDESNANDPNQLNLIKNIMENSMKSRLMISGDTEEITMNATQMLYEWLKDTEEIEVDKEAFAHVLGRYKRTIYAIVNEVESKFIDGGQYREYFESEQIAENESSDPFWLEGLRLSIFPIDEEYGKCSIWTHGPPFMRKALRYYINSVVLVKLSLYLYVFSAAMVENVLCCYRVEESFCLRMPPHFGLAACLNIKQSVL